ARSTGSGSARTAWAVSLARMCPTLTRRVEWSAAAVAVQRCAARVASHLQCRESCVLSSRSRRPAGRPARGEGLPPEERDEALLGLGEEGGEPGVLATGTQGLDRRLGPEARFALVVAARQLAEDTLDIARVPLLLGTQL